MTEQGSLLYQQYSDISRSNLIKIDTECPITNSTYLIVSNATREQQGYIDQLSSQISSSEDVESLLDHVNWRMFVHLCEQPCSNFRYSQYELEHNCSKSCCFSDSFDKVLAISSCGNSSCTSFVNSYVITKWYIFLVLGLLCLFGNMIVICDKVISVLKAKNLHKEIQIHHTLVLNLALADLVMGVFLIAVAFEIKHKVDIGVYFSEPKLCNSLGILNVVSSQVSITTLLIISLHRLVGVIKPFKQPHLKVVLILVAMTWMVWLMVATLPLIPLEPLETTFTFGLVKNFQFDQDTLVDYSFFNLFFREQFLPLSYNITEVNVVLHAVNQFPTSSVMEKFSNSLGWVNFEKDNWTSVGYYSLQYSCSMDFFLSNEDYRIFNHFTLIFVLYNLIVSVAMLVSYLFVTFKVYENDTMCFARCKCCLTRCFCEGFLSNSTFFQGANAARYTENYAMFKRLSFIIPTDLICWIPLCIASLVIWHIPFSIQSKEEVLASIIPFQTTLLIVVPFNSIVNPYIYSYHLWSRLCEKIKH